MNALKLTVFMLVMIVALATLTDADFAHCCECLNDNFKLTKEYIHSIIKVMSPILSF